MLVLWLVRREGTGPCCLQRGAASCPHPTASPRARHAWVCEIGGGEKTLSGVTKSCSFSAFLQGWESVWPLKSRLRAWCAGVSSQKGFTYGIAPRNPSRDSCFHKLDIEQRGALLLRRPGAQ